MGPVLLLLLLAAEKSEFTATPPENSTGLKFFVAFPENIAYYHPDPLQNTIQLTALYDNTSIELKYNTVITKMFLNQGESKNYTCEIMETGQTYAKDISDKVLQITSNKHITVYAINLRNNSVQTALVLPTDKLATEYLIPPVPNIQGTTLPADMVTIEVTERGPFRLVIINGDEQISVTVKGTDNEVVSLDSNHILRIWLNKTKQFRSVTASKPVTVLFGHICALRNNCTCGLLYAALPPAKEEKLKFYIPPSLDIESEAFILVSNKTGTSIKPFNPDSPLVETAGTAIFYHPGLLLTLIPESDFASCYVVHGILDAQNKVVIVLHKNFTDGVHVGGLRLVNQWQDLKGTDYVSTTVVLALGKSIIWHVSSVMAVYFMGTKESSWFGNPAAIISTSPDFRGCVLSPEVIKIGDVADGWRESVKYCKEQDMELLSFSKAEHQRQIYGKLLQTKSDSLQEVWIGMRRSSQSGEWYWLNQDPVNDTDWKEGEPGTVQDGQCVAMGLDKNMDFGWSDKDCCEAAHPLCYREPILLGKAGVDRT